MPGNVRGVEDADHQEFLVSGSGILFENMVRMRGNAITARVRGTSVDGGRRIQRSNGTTWTKTSK